MGLPGPGEKPGIAIAVVMKPVQTLFFCYENEI